MSSMTWMVRLEEQIIDFFRQGKALTAESALAPPAWRSRTERQMFARFVRKRALVATGDGRYYLDEGRWVEYSKRRWGALYIYIAVVVIVVIALIILIP